MMALLEFVTRFGSVLVALPLALLLALWLATHRRWRGAWEWLLLIAAVVAAVAAIKLYFAGCGLRIYGVRSPSGHASMSLLAYGGYAVVLVRGLRGGRRWALGLAALLWIALIGYSRVALHAHTPQEVWAAWALTAPAVLVFALRHGASLKPSPRLLAAALVLGVAISMQALGRVSPEAWLGRLGHLLVQQLPICPAR